MTAKESTPLTPARTQVRRSFGHTPEGEEAHLFTLSNRRGMELQITDFGARIVSLKVPDRRGRIADVVLGYDSCEGYAEGNPYFGATIGRYANRIAAGRFQLDGKAYRLAVNDGPNALHGGPRKGFHNVVWAPEEHAGVKLTYTAEDGEEGYPGRLVCTVIYSLKDSNELIIDYRARTDRATPINLTHHGYFNLKGAGNGDVLGHLLTLEAAAFTPVDASLIPTGEIRPVAGTPLDFQTPRLIGARIGEADEQLLLANGYDHNFVLTPRDGVRLAATVREPESGRCLEVHTTEPGLQFYSDNFPEDSGPLKGRDPRTSFCLEPQHFPDSPNQPGFPDTILRPGKTWRSRTVFRFFTAP